VGEGSIQKYGRGVGRDSDSQVSSGRHDFGGRNASMGNVGLASDKKPNAKNKRQDLSVNQTPTRSNLGREKKQAVSTNDLHVKPKPATSSGTKTPTRNLHPELTQDFQAPTTTSNLFKTNDFTQRMYFDSMMTDSKLTPRELRDPHTKRLLYHGHLDPKTQLPSGKGICYLSDNTQIQGLFQSGIPCGPGTKYTQDGMTKISKGLFSGPNLSGYGKTYHPNGQPQYIGHFLKDVPQSQTTLYSESGQTLYQGSYQDGAFHGPGKKHYKNGDFYTGNFQLGLRHGSGEMHFYDGSKITGIWENGKLKKKTSEIGVLRDESGKMLYKGELRENRANGKGVQY
jgi:hypothetical protein